MAGDLGLKPNAPQGRRSPFAGACQTLTGFGTEFRTHVPEQQVREGPDGDISELRDGMIVPRLDGGHMTLGTLGAHEGRLALEDIGIRNRVLVRDTKPYIWVLVYLSDWVSPHRHSEATNILFDAVDKGGVDISYAEIKVKSL